MKPQLPLAVLVAAALVSGPGAAPDRGALVLEATGCKPSAPVEIELLESSVANGVAFVRYEVRSLLEGARLDATVLAPEGGVVLGARPVRAEAVERGSRRTGSSRVRLPAGRAGVRLTVRAALTFPASGGELDGQEETVVATRTLTFGTVDSTPDLPTVESDGVASLEVPAVRVGGSKR